MENVFVVQENGEYLKVEWREDKTKDMRTKETEPGTSSNDIGILGLSMNTEENNENKFIWQDKYVTILIQTRLDLDDEFENPKTRKAKIWQKLADVMRERAGESLEGLTGTVCDSKWRNLLQTYKKVAFKKSAGIHSSWPYYDMIHNGFGEKVIVKTTPWYEKDEDDDNWFERSKEEDKWFKKSKDGDKSDDPLVVSLKRTVSPDVDQELVEDDSDDEKPIIQKSKKKKKKMSTLQLLRKEIAEKRKEDKMYDDEKKQRWEEKKAIERERTQAILQLTTAINKYTSKKIELVISQRK